MKRKILKRKNVGEGRMEEVQACWIEWEERKRVDFQITTKAEK
jgi:hypothetical protein